MSGRIETIVGGMFAGKTEELIRRLRRATFAGKKVLGFKPAMDNRYSATDIASHAGVTFPSIPVRNSDEILEHLHQYGQLDVVGIDEVQFFDARIGAVADILAGRGLRVVLAGLDMDYMGEPFGPVPRLLAVSDTVTKVTAVCMKCGADATRTQRLISTTDRILVGTKDIYEARCRGCWTPTVDG